MQIEITHEKNPLMGWDVCIKVTVEDTEKIASVVTTINMIPRPREEFEPPTSVYTKTLERVGNFPGENTVQVVVTDQNNVQTNGVDSW